LFFPSVSQALLNQAPRNATLKSGPNGATCTFIPHQLFKELQKATGGRLGAKMVASQQHISFDDWVHLVWRLGYHQPEIRGPWEMKDVGEY
jgi:hypothetical protein